MFVRFVAPDLDSLDALEAEVLVLSLYEDERPLQGLTGLVDWRLSGQLSQWIVDQRLSGSAGEKLMVPGRPRLRVDRLLVFGLGPKAEFGEPQFRDLTTSLVQTLEEARLSSVAISLPGRHIEGSAPDTRFRALLEAIGDRALLDELIVVESPATHRALTELVARERRRARAETG